MTVNRTRNNGAKLIVKHFNTSVAQHFYPIKITTWNALQNEVVSRRTVNSFKHGHRTVITWQNGSHMDTSTEHDQTERKSNKQTNNNDLLEKYGGTKNCIYKD